MEERSRVSTRTASAMELPLRRPRMALASKAPMWTTCATGRLWRKTATEPLQSADTMSTVDALRIDVLKQQYI